MTPQSSFMVVVPIRADRRGALDSLLASMNTAPGRVDPRNTLLPFSRFDELHSARFVIIEAHTRDDIRAFGMQPCDFPDSLAFLGEVDGNSADFLAQLAVRARDGLARIYTHCQGFDDHHGTLLEFLEQHQAEPAASYVNWIGRTVRQIHEDIHLQRFLAVQLAALRESQPDAGLRQIRQQLLTRVQLEQHAGRLTLTPEARTPCRVWLRKALDLIVIPLLLIVFLPVLIILVPLVFLYLRTLEKRDPDIDILPSVEHSRNLSAIEDHDVTNQFNVFGDVKPGLFRYGLLKSVMGIVDYTARNLYGRGFLARVRTIHFARWVFLNDRRSLFFASTYDGSLESYMDDFINKVAFGLNLTFSHGVGYPRTRWMIKGGAELEQPFKATLRRHQLPSSVWYRAYPGLTAFDLARHARIRRGVEQYPECDEAIRQWLREI